MSDGIDLVAFSGDKLLGGPQAGIVVGKRTAMARLRNDPLLRALRADKMTLAALGATLALHRTAASRARIPLYRMLGTTLDELRARANAYARALPGATIVESSAFVGGGALPQTTLPSIALSYPCAHPQRVAAALRRENPAVVARIAENCLLFDLRTVAPEEDEGLLAAVTFGTAEEL